jgi:glycosyltransferase involved in cell wall biosynthesis
MKSDYRISVLIPCHSTKFLSESIASIREQTLSKNEFEIVIVADRVDPAEVVDILVGSHINYRIISSESPGIVAALNTGLQNISSDYVARMDEDDLMYPSRLQVQLKYLDSALDCVAVGGQLELIDENGSRIGESRFHRRVGTSYKELFLSSPVAHPAAMIRRSAISEIGGYRAFLAEDWDLWVRLRETGKVHNLPQKVIKYRVHSNQLSRQKMYAQSRARLIVGVSYFARQAKLADGPRSTSDVEAWLAESIEYLRDNSLRFRKFLRWAKRLDLYQEKFNSLLTTKKVLIGLALLTGYPIWFLRDMLKKVLR